MNAAVLKSPKPMQELGRYQFSLRRMFIATTAVAAVFGLAVWGGWVHSDAVVYLSIAVVAAVFSSIARRTLLGGCVILALWLSFVLGGMLFGDHSLEGDLMIALDICRFPASLRHDVAALHQGWRILALGIAASGRDICSNGDRVYVWPSDPISSVCQRGSTVCYPTSAKLFPHHRAMADRNTLASGDRSRRGSGPTKKGQTIVNDHCCQELKRGEVHAVAHHRSTGKRTGGAGPVAAGVCQPGSRCGAGGGGVGRGQRRPLAADAARTGVEIPRRRRAAGRGDVSRPTGRKRHRPAQGQGRPAHLPYRPPAGRPHSPAGGRRGDAREHVSDAARRAGGGATLRRGAAISAAGRPRAAADVLGPLRALLGETSGAILVSGPAGSGKTTTLYACLRELAHRTAGQRSLVSIEDPIEVAVEGVAQSQVRPAAGLDLAVGLRFLMRQDPEVIMVGEIRDRATAEAALQASLTGHLVLSTFHAGSAAETVGRLLDMGIEPYVLRSGLLAVLNQRLLRRLCALRLRERRPRRPPGPAGGAGEGARRLRGVPRHRLQRAVSAGGNAAAVAERVGAGDPFPLRYGDHGAAGAGGADGEPLAAGLPGRRGRAHQSGRGSPAVGIFHSPPLV